MFPVALLVATLANATGIEGATFFSPIFILVLKLDPLIAIGTALITEVFGFGSGVLAYYRRRLIDFRLATHLLVVTVPLALLGVFLATLVPSIFLKGLFGVGLLIIGVVFLRSPSVQDTAVLDTQIEANNPPQLAERTLTTAQGETIRYTVCNRTEGMAMAGIGGIFMGMIGSGQGEMNGYFFLRRCHVPLKVAVATSAFVVAITALVASVGHFYNFVQAGGDTLLQVMSLVIYTIPGVLIGGQLGPILATRIDKHKMEKFLGGLFIFISFVTLWSLR